MNCGLTVRSAGVVRIAGPAAAVVDQGHVLLVAAVIRRQAISTTLYSTPFLPAPTTNQPLGACTMTMPPMRTATNHRLKGTMKRPAASVRPPAISTIVMSQASACPAGMWLEARNSPKPLSSERETRHAVNHQLCRDDETHGGNGSVRGDERHGISFSVGRSIVAVSCGHTTFRPHRSFLIAPAGTAPSGWRYDHAGCPRHPVFDAGLPGARAGRRSRTADRRPAGARDPVYNLKPGRRDAFHDLVVRDAIPLLRRWKMDVVAHGPSRHDADS